MSGTATDTALTIDELAKRVGMTVRNLREWKTLGLLPAADVRGRVGYYPETVVTRIEGVQKLHAEGFTLELIRRMLETSGEAGDDVLELAGALRAPFRDAHPPVLERAEWEQRWGASSDAHVRRAAELGLVRERADGRIELTSAAVARVGERLRALGLTIDQTLDATAAIRTHADGMAAVFEQLWLDHVWTPFLAAGSPDDAAPALRAALADVRPFALDAVTAIFSTAMEARIEDGIAREIERAAAG